MSRRYKTLRNLPRDVCPEGKVTRDLADRRHLGLWPVVLVIDECQLAFDDDPEMVALVTDLGKRGPAAGIIVLLATQRVDAKSLPTAISSNAVLRYCMKVAGQVENDMVLGTSMYKAGVRATTFARTDRGVGYLAGEGDEPDHRPHRLPRRPGRRDRRRPRPRRPARRRPAHRARRRDRPRPRRPAPPRSSTTSPRCGRPVRRRSGGTTSPNGSPPPTPACTAPGPVNRSPPPSDPTASARSRSNAPSTASSSTAAASPAPPSTPSSTTAPPTAPTPGPPTPHPQHHQPHRRPTTPAPDSPATPDPDPGYQ